MALLPRPQSLVRLTFASAAAALVVGTAAPPTQAQAPATRVEWGECGFDTEGLPTERLRCGFLLVPETRGDPGSRRIRIAFAVAEAQQPGPRPDAILYLPGGPGAGDLGPGLMGPGAQYFAVERDFVAVDLRGSGYSQPVLCPALARTVDQARALDLTADEYRLVVRGAIIGCRDQLSYDGVDLASYNATAMAADLEALRQALGYEQWNLFGVSAGTRVAQILMREHPATIRSAVLNSPIPLDVDVGANRVSNYIRSLDRLFETCSEDPACRAEYPQLRNTFQETFEALAEAPMSLRTDAAARTGTFTLNGADFVTLVHAALYHDAHLPFVPAYIRAVHQRNTSAVRALVDRFLAPPDRLAAGLYYAATCHDQFDPSSTRSPADAPAPFRTFFDHQAEACELFHPHRASADERRPYEGTIPTLIRSGPFDPITPPEYGERIARGVSTAYHVGMPASSHTMNGAGVFCLVSMMRAFWDAPHRAPPRDCVAARAALVFEPGLPDWAR